MYSIIIIPDCFLNGREFNPDHTSARTHAQTSVGSCLYSTTALPMT